MHLLYVEDGVGVGGDQALVAIAVVVFGGAGEEVLLFEVGDDELPGGVDVDGGFGVLGEVLVGCAGERVEGNAGKS